MLRREQTVDVYDRLIRLLWNAGSRRLFERVSNEVRKLTPAAAAILEKAFMDDERQPGLFLGTLLSRVSGDCKDGDSKRVRFRHAFERAFSASAKVTVVSSNPEIPPVSERHTNLGTRPTLKLITNPDAPEIQKRRAQIHGNINFDLTPQLSVIDFNPDIPANRKPRPAPLRICES